MKTGLFLSAIFSAFLAGASLAVGHLGLAAVMAATAIGCVLLYIEKQLP
jgi:hypothetical protein